MKRLVPAMQREWLQHRFAWSLLVLVPLALLLALTWFGHVDLDNADRARLGAALPTVLALASIAATLTLMFLIVWFSSLIIVSGLARRDQADRSVEFWMSLPLSHSESLAAPLIVHLLIVPACALALGLAGGYAVSAVVVSRAADFGAWLALPWGTVVPASLALTLRLLAGLPLATLWLLPLILLVVLTTAWFGRWGWVLLTVGLGLGSYLLKRIFGEPLLNETVTQLFKNAARALIPAMGSDGSPVEHPSDFVDAFQKVPAWLAGDLASALRELGSPLLLGALLFSAACFYLIISWRQRSPGAAA